MFFMGSSHVVHVFFVSPFVVQTNEELEQKKKTMSYVAQSVAAKLQTKKLPEVEKSNRLRTGEWVGQQLRTRNFTLFFWL